MKKAKKLIRMGLEALLATRNLKLTKRDAFKEYISFSETIQSAKEKGMTVGEYIDWKYNVPGETQKTIDRMEELGAFRKTKERICEIGPGSGRYLEKVQAICHPANYEIYETADEWRKWLVNQYGVVAHPCDGVSLKTTPNNTVDLAHAHKVFPGLRALTILGYFIEMIRIVREDGHVVFDILTERCLQEDALKNWLEPRCGYVCSAMPEQYTIEFFKKRSFSFCGSFLITMKPGITEYLVFQKKGNRWCSKI